MKCSKTMTALALVAVLFSCTSVDSNKITGAYAREASREEKNINTEMVIGHSFIRDTIFITKKKDGYQVDQLKWRKNDYDSSGWVNQLHSGSRPMSAFMADYDPTDHTLVPRQVLAGKMIYFDLQTGTISLDKNLETKWTKVK